MSVRRKLLLRLVFGLALIASLSVNWWVKSGRVERVVDHAQEPQTSPSTRSVSEEELAVDRADVVESFVGREVSYPGLDSVVVETDERAEHGDAHVRQLQTIIRDVKSRLQMEGLNDLELAAYRLDLEALFFKRRWTNKSCTVCYRPSFWSSRGMLRTLRFSSVSKLF